MTHLSRALTALRSELEPLHLTGVHKATEDFGEDSSVVTDAALIGLVGNAFNDGRIGRETLGVLAHGRQLRHHKRAVPLLGTLEVVTVSESPIAALIGSTGTASTSSA